PGVGDVRDVALDAQAVRAVERRQLHGPVDEARAAAAELAQHAAAQVALEHAVVAAVGHVEVVARDRQADREAQRQHGLTAAAHLDALDVERARRGLGLQPAHRGAALAQVAIAHEALALAAGGVPRDPRGPGLHAVGPPAGP